MKDVSLSLEAPWWQESSGIGHGLIGAAVSEPLSKTCFDQSKSSIAKAKNFNLIFSIGGPSGFCVPNLSLLGQIFIPSAQGSAISNKMMS